MKTNFTEYCRIKKSVSSRIKHKDFDKAFENKILQQWRNGNVREIYFRKNMEIHENIFSFKVTQETKTPLL